MLVLTESSRTIRISHWGNIGVDEHFEVQNIGASVKGEFNRVDYEKPRYAINCLTEIQAEYPWYIQGMYVYDFIGNISTTNAFRGEESVKLEFKPRFGICGGWKTDWNQGYNVPTKYHLKVANNDHERYSFDFTFLHNYDVFLAENYTVEVVLPYGATDIKVSSTLSSS